MVVVVVVANAALSERVAKPADVIKSVGVISSLDSVGVVVAARVPAVVNVRRVAAVVNR